MCKFICFSFHFKLFSSILFLTCFSAFHFMVMVDTMKFFHIQRKEWTSVACTTIWLMTLEAVSPVNFLTSSKVTQNMRSSCFNLTSSENLSTIRRLLTSLTFFLPLLLVTLCYVLIICTLATGPTHGLATNKRCCWWSSMCAFSFSMYLGGSVAQDQKKNVPNNIRTDNINSSLLMKAFIKRLLFMLSMLILFGKFFFRS